jgi:hypothetical protein
MLLTTEQGGKMVNGGWLMFPPNSFTLKDRIISLIIATRNYCVAQFPSQ